MNKELFKECVNAVLKHVAEELKDEIKEQIDLMAWDDYDEAQCNTMVALNHLENVFHFEYLFEKGDDKDTPKLKDVVFMVLYEEPYYGFDVVEIINESGIDADAEEFNKILISYLKGELSLHELQGNRKRS